MDGEMTDGNESEDALSSIPAKHKIRYRVWKKGFEKLIRIINGAETVIPKVEAVSDTSSDFTSETDYPNDSDDNGCDSDLEVIDEIINNPFPSGQSGTATPVRGNKVILNTGRRSALSISPGKSPEGTPPSTNPVGVQRQLDFSNNSETPSTVNNIENILQRTHVSPAILTEAEILEKAFAMLKDATANFFHGPDRMWMTNEDLITNWQNTTEGILNTWKADYGDRINSMMLKLISNFVDVQHTKIQSTNNVHKQTFDIVKEEFEKRFENVGNDFSSEWLKKSKGDIIAMYSNDDTHGFQLVNSLGEVATSCYRRFKAKNVDILFDIVQKLRIYDSMMRESLDKRVCCAEISELDQFHKLAIEAAGLTAINTGEHLVKKSEEIIQAIRSSQREMNFQAIENETLIAQKAVNYAVNAFSDIVKSMLDISSERLKAERSEITTAVIECFFEVQDFFYTHPWMNQKDDLTSLLEEKCTELLKKYESEKADTLEGNENLIEKQCLLFERITKSHLQEVDQGIALKDDIRSRRWRVDCAVEELKTIAAETLGTLERQHGSKDCGALIISTVKFKFNKIIDNYAKCAYKSIDNPPGISSSTVVEVAEPLPACSVIPESSSSNVSQLPRPNSTSVSEAIRPSPANAILESHPLSETSAELQVLPAPIQTMLSTSTAHAYTTPKICNAASLQENTENCVLRDTGIGIIFYCDGVYVAYGGEKIDHLTMATKFVIAKKGNDAVFDPPLPHEKGITDGTSYNVLKLLNDAPKKLNTRFPLSGRNVLFWVEQAIALFFIKLKNAVNAKWGIGLAPYTITVALPMYMKSICRKRLKSALRLAGLENSVFVQTTTAIGATNLLNGNHTLEATTDQQILTLFINDKKVLDVAVLRVVGRKVAVLAVEGSKSFPELKEEITASVSEKLDRAFKNILKCDKVELNLVKQCTCVVDFPNPAAEETQRFWLSEILQKVLYALSGRKIPVKVLNLQEGIFHGLVTISRHPKALQAPVYFEEKYPCSWNLSTAEGATPPKISQWIYKNRQCDNKSTRILLGQQKSTAVIRRFEDMEFTEALVSPISAIKNYHETDVVKLEVSPEDLMTLTLVPKSEWTINGPSKSGANPREVQKIVKVNCMPESSFNRAKLQVNALIVACEGRLGEPPPTKKRKTMTNQV